MFCRFIPKEDGTITGNFEVTILNTGERIHSKKRGKGRAETSTERAAIVKKLEQTLASMGYC
jgi:hypothetical protein